MTTMFKHSIKMLGLGLLSACLSLNLYAQDNKGQKHRHKLSREKIYQHKKNFFVKELQLGEKETNNLMEVLKELDQKRFELWKPLQETRSRLRKKEKLSQEEYNKYFEQVLDTRVKEAELERSYYKKCKGFIPVEKLVHLEYSNREFAKKYFRKHKCRKH